MKVKTKQIISNHSIVKQKTILKHENIEKTIFETIGYLALFISILTHLFSKHSFVIQSKKDGNRV